MTGQEVSNSSSYFYIEFSLRFIGLGTTIIDSLSTLFIMDLKEEYYQARQWVAYNLTFEIGKSESLFEVTIRLLGGLLSAYDLTGDELYLNKAYELAAAFDKSDIKKDYFSGFKYVYFNKEDVKVFDASGTNAADSIKIMIDKKLEETKGKNKEKIKKVLNYWESLNNKG